MSWARVLIAWSLIHLAPSLLMRVVTAVQSEVVSNLRERIAALETQQAGWDKQMKQLQDLHRQPEQSRVEMQRSLKEVSTSGSRATVLAAAISIIGALIAASVGILGGYWVNYQLNQVRWEQENATRYSQERLRTYTDFLVKAEKVRTGSPFDQSLLDELDTPYHQARLLGTAPTRDATNHYMSALLDFIEYRREHPASEGTEEFNRLHEALFDAQINFIEIAQSEAGIPFEASIERVSK